MEPTDTGVQSITVRKAIVRVTLVTAALLSVPLVAMQFTDEVVWGLTDFGVAAALLLGAGLLYELVALRSHSAVLRAAAGAAIGAVLLLVWANLAVSLL